MAALCSGVGLLTAGAITWRMPEIHESRAVLEEPSPPVVDSRAAADVSALGERLLSRQVLTRVLIRLGWPHQEGAELEESLGKLRAMASVNGINPVTLRVRHAEPSEAREIAWAIVDSFGQVRTEGHWTDIQQNVREMTAQVAVQEQNLAAAREKLEAVARRVTPEEIAKHPESYALPEGPMSEEELLEAGRQLAARDPRLSPVILREVPEVPLAPVSPVWWLNLTLGALAGLAVSPLVAWIAAACNRQAKNC